MPIFSLVTTDNTYSYTSGVTENDNGRIRFEIQHNTKTSDTQGFFHKRQIGRYRTRARIIFGDTKTKIEASVLPMLIHPQNITVTFDRNIPTKTTTSATYTMDDLKILREFNNGTEYELELTLTEVLTP
jgi:hypothetical protein